MKLLLSAGYAQSTQLAGPKITLRFPGNSSSVSLFVHPHLSPVVGDSNDLLMSRLAINFKRELRYWYQYRYG